MTNLEKLLSVHCSTKSRDFEDNFNIGGLLKVFVTIVMILVVLSCLLVCSVNIVGIGYLILNWGVSHLFWKVFIISCLSLLDLFILGFLGWLKLKS